MMRTNRLWMAALCALALAAPFAARADESSTKKELTAIFNKAVTAFKKKDIDGFMSMYHADYVGTTIDGRAQKVSDLRSEMITAMANTKSVEKARLNFHKLRQFGYTSEVTSTMTLKMKVVDTGAAFGKKGATHDLVLIEKAKETWVLSDGKWKLKASTALPGSRFVLDGKPLPTQSASATPAGTATARGPSKSK